MTFLRLDPAHPALWRDETTLQLGARAIATLRDPSPWQLRVLHAMEHGVDSRTLERLTVALDVPAAELSDLLSRVESALARPVEPRSVQLRAADGVDATTCSDIAEALGTAGIAATWASPNDGADGDAVVLLAHHQTPPHVAAQLMADDVPHLAVIFDAAGVTVGPLVDPGRTACLACLAEHERDRDDAWPALAAQLVSRAPVPVPRARAMEAGTLAARLLRDAPPATSGAGRGPGAVSASRSVRSTGDARRAWRSHRPHPTCLCRSASAPGAPLPDADRSPRGTATAPAARVPHPTAAPTTSTACARPA
jgi:hypothetical protein